MSDFIELSDYDVQTKEEIIELLDDSEQKIAFDKAEKMAIDQIKNMLGTRYDTTSLFSKRGGERDMYIVMLTIDLALYHIWSSKAPNQIPQIRIDRYNIAIEWLTDAGKGEIETNLPTVPEENYKGRLRLGSRYLKRTNKW